MNKTQRQHGASMAVILSVVAVLVILGALGWIFYKNMTGLQTIQEPAKVVKEEKPADSVCKDNGNEHASDGIFCSEDFGFSFKVPYQLNDAFREATTIEYVDVEGSETVVSKKAFRESKEYEGFGAYSFEVSEYPLEDMTVRLMISAQFDAASKTFYDTNEEGQRKEVDNQIVDGQKVYTMGLRDGGNITTATAFVKNDRLFIIKLAGGMRLGPKDESNPEYSELNQIMQSVKSINTMPADISLKIY